jgi:hypothetical protein
MADKIASLSAVKSAKHTGLEITECPICLETFKNPKCLPCLHTFCLKCLENYAKDKLDMGKLECPLCRKQLAIPKAGLRKLPKNFFIEHLFEMQSFSLSESRETACEWCAEAAENGSPAATKYCLECGQNLCESCNGRHRKITVFRSHRVIPINEKNGSVIKSRASFCDLHEEEIKLYCYDCKKSICMMCKGLEHDRHACTHVKEVAQKFSKELQDHYPSFDKCMTAEQAELT